MAIKNKVPTCSFCKKDQSQVKHLIASVDVYICNECVDICSETIHTVQSKSLEPSFEIVEQQSYYALLQNYDEVTVNNMNEWLKENVEEYYVRSYTEDKRNNLTYKFVFNNESDVVAFKLRWI